MGGFVLLKALHCSACFISCYGQLHIVWQIESKKVYLESIHTIYRVYCSAGWVRQAINYNR